MPDLPCDSDGVCMVCKIVPPDQDVLLCGSCSSPWHMACLCPPLQSVPLDDWSCPDCSLSPDFSSSSISMSVEKSGDLLVGKIRAVQSDSSLSEEQKARRCQELMSNAGKEDANALDYGKKSKDLKDSMLDILDENLNCIFCMQIAERPITTPCGHNFCLRCFQRWIGQGKKNCGKCRANIPAKFASQPRINSTLVMAIRMVKAAAATGGNKTAAPKPIHYINNQNRPDKAFMTERAKLPGKANACSGKIFVTTPSDYFGPITAEYDPERNQGVLVGESWADRMECRQWGTHLPHVAGIAGQSDHGAQSVALSGGYEDDEDHGEWFIYTGSGGRDLSGNKRTNKLQSSDQKFELMNEALRVSCKKGYPVRVVRSYKEKRSSYAPAEGVRYDGVYRIEKCWRKQGIQGFKVCRYLFVRCDNEPAPWTSDEHGDLIRPLPTVDELKFASDITERKGHPAWDWNDSKWCWVKPPPCTRKREDGKTVKRGERKQLSIQQKLLKEFGCGLCKNVLKLPLSTPCGHNFCKSCLELQFAGQKDVCDRARVGGRALRARKVLKHCPTCGHDITDFVLNPQVNRQMQSVIQSLKESDANEFPDDSPMPSFDESTQKTIEGSTDKKGPKEDVVICNVDDVKFNVQNDKFERSPDEKGPKEDVVICNLQNEKLFKELCCKYTDYSEDLLQAMLADQDGDLEELSALLRKLQSQTTQTQKKRPRQSQDTETRHSKRH